MMNKKQTLLRLMASALLSSTALLGVGLLPTTAMAQTFDEDNLLVTDGADDSADISATSFTDYFIGEFGLVDAKNGAVDRNSVIYNVGLNVPFSFGRFYATYGGVETEITIKQTLRDPNDINSMGLPRTRTRTVKTDDVDLREAFLQINLGSSVTLYAGRQRNAWGQFELFSPAVIMQPLNANFTSLLPNKVDLLQAQDQVQISIFPTSRIELSLYSMSSLRTDKTAEENTKDWVSPQSTSGGSGVINETPVIRANSFPTNEFDIEFEEIKDPKQSAVRLAFYPNWGTVAFTQHKGYNAFNPALKTPVGVGLGGQFLDEYGMPIAGSNNVLDSVSSVYVDKDNSYLYYPEGTLNAFEMSIPVGNWTWRYETAVIESINGLDGLSGNISLYSANGFTEESVVEFIQAAYADERDENLRGTGLFKSKTTTTAFGFQYQGAEWKADVAIYSFRDAEATTEAGKRLQAAYKALEEQGRSSVEFGEFFPLFNGFRKRGDEDQHTYGYSLGALGVGFGIGGFYSYNFTEDLSLGFSAGAIGLDNSSGGGEDVYETDAEGLTTQLSVAWRF